MNINNAYITTFPNINLLFSIDAIKLEILCLII